MSPYVVPRRSAGLVGPVLMVTIVGLMLVDARPAHPASDRLVTGPPNHPSEIIRGTVSANGLLVDGATVQLLRAGSAQGTAQQLRTTTSDLSGSFVLHVPHEVDDRAVLYLTSAGGLVGGQEVPEEVELATALGDRRSGPIVVNELTTVAAGFSLAQFAQDGSLGGANPGLRNAAIMPRNLVSIATGEISRFLRRSPNGGSTQTLATFDSLASIIAGCVAGTNDCDAFLDAATDALGANALTPRGRR